MSTVLAWLLLVVIAWFNGYAAGYVSFPAFPVYLLGCWYSGMLLGRLVLWTREREDL